MIRIVLLSLALVAAPFIFYGLYELLRQGPDGTGPRRPSEWERQSVTRLGFAGLALVAMGIAAVLITPSGSRDGVYIPAHVENGKLIPGEFIDAEESSQEEPVDQDDAVNQQ